MAELKVPSGLTKRVIVLCIILLPIMFFLAEFNQQLTTRPWTFSGFWLAYIWILIINELVGRINPKWRLSIQEMSLLYIPFWMMVGSYYFLSGTPNNSWVNMQFGINTAIWAKMTEPYATNWADAIPPYWAPTEPEAVRAAYSGLRPGEVLNWGAWTVPILYWSTGFFIWVLLGQLWAAMFRKQLIEEEKLPFVCVIPIAYTTRTYYDIDPQTNKSRLFSLKGTHLKIFWVCFLVGLIGSIWPFIMEIIPALPSAAGVWGSVWFDYTPYTRDALPGAQFAGWLDNIMWPLLVFLPFDLLWSFNIAWVVFGIIVPVVLVRTGTAPYEVGVETYTSWYFGWRPPFHYAFFAMTGMVIGIGIWTIYVARHHIIRAFNAISSLWKGRESEYYDQGIPLGKISLGIVVFSIAMLVFWSASGIPFIIALAELVLFTLFTICSMRLTAEYCVFPPVGFYMTHPTLYSIGVLTGTWPSAPTTNPTAVRALTLDIIPHGWDTICFTGASYYTIYQYKVGDSTKTNALDIFKMTTIMTALATIAAYIIMVWWINHVGGLEHTNWGGGEIGSTEATLNTGFQAVDYGHATHWTYMIAGAIFSIILYILRARFIWMGFLNPAAWMMSLWIVEWTFPYAIPAIIVKYLIVKVGGVRALEEKYAPAVTGWLVGWGSMFVIVAIRSIFIESLPNFWSLYVP